MKIINCPNCGGEVQFRSAASAMAVCTYCRSTVLRDAATVANIGKLSEILDDYSPIQIGTAGTWRAKPFNVLGRLRLKYEDGGWNEWNVEFGDGTQGWLSDASGQYVMTRRATGAQPPAPMQEMAAGRGFNVKGQRYVVSDARACVCVGGEGELPEPAHDKQEFQSVDLRAVGGNGFITVDYSSEPPAIYAGEAVARADLALTNLRAAEVVDAATGKMQGGVTGFDCPNCGASLEYHAGFGQSIACPTCKAVVDLEGDRRTVLLKQSEVDSRPPTIALGTQGTLRGAAYEIIGFMSRADDEGTAWEEYLLFSKTADFLWLIHAEGNWLVGDVINGVPDVRGDEVYLAGKVYRSDTQYTATTRFVLGEFNWRVRVGDEVRVDEWVAGGASLARETYQQEVTWTVSNKIPAAVVTKAFSLETALPEAPAAVLGKGSAIIPKSWFIIACVVAFLLDALAESNGGGNGFATFAALAALWIPYPFVGRDTSDSTGD